PCPCQKAQPGAVRIPLQKGVDICCWVRHVCHIHVDRDRRGRQIGWRIHLGAALDLARVPIALHQHERRHYSIFFCVYVSDEMLTAAPLEIATEFRFKLAPDVPTLPSNSDDVPSDFNTRNHVAVPLAFAELSAVIALAVATPFTAAPNAVAFSRNSASST